MIYMNHAINTTDKSSIYADEMGWWELPRKCECGRPLHLTSGGDIPFCPLCAKKKEEATQCRTVLIRAMIAYAQRAMAHEKEKRDHEEANRLNAYGVFSSGLPL